MSLLSKFNRWLRETPGAADISRHRKAVTQARELNYGDATDVELQQALSELPASFIDDDRALGRFLALAAELAKRHVGLAPFDVQLHATAAMVRGTSVQMATGEGKTLVGALVALGHVVAGRRVHVLGANDYLAERDAQWMGTLFAAAGFRAASVVSTLPREVRTERYAADVVYVSVSEAGFDVLRDRTALDVDAVVGVRNAQVAVVDEADAVLIDDASVPLVLAGDIASDGHDVELAALARELIEGEDYVVDSERRNVHFSDAGLEKVEAHFEEADLFGADHHLLTRAQLALHAQALLHRDVDYVVDAEGIRVISQSRGRVEALQRWPEGVQVALEAKEGLTQGRSTVVLDQLRIADLLRGYDQVVGMSATLVPVAAELTEFAKLDVGALEPNVPCQRIDEADRLFATAAERDAAAVDAIAQAQPQPVLVVCQSVAESERVGELLSARGIDHVLLNAKNDHEEADLIARAGELGRVTVSTQIAGRGTDIRLDDAARDAGGLVVIGFGRFANQRLDLQARGRSGRQGDPGRSQFFTSLDDDLVTKFGDHLAGLPERGELSAKWQQKFDQCQRICEGQRAELQRMSHRYGALIALQSEEFQAVRSAYLEPGAAAKDLADAAPQAWDKVKGQADADVVAQHLLLSALDAGWSDYLGYALEVREGIHLRELGSEVPVDQYTKLIAEAFQGLPQRALDVAVDAVRAAADEDRPLTLAASGLAKPSATWTYMVTDQHFGGWVERLGRRLKSSSVQ